MIVKFLVYEDIRYTTGHMAKIIITIDQMDFQFAVFVKVLPFLELLICNRLPQAL